ncbi:MAG: HPr(Ser) kinase/phosphatase [Mycoplasmoidaceae bacterium]
MKNINITWENIQSELDWLKLCNAGNKKIIKYYGISRVGLELAGEYYSDSIDITILLGGIEFNYLSRFNKDIINKKINKIMKLRPPLIILSQGFDYELIKDLAIANNITVFKSNFVSAKIFSIYGIDLLTKFTEKKSIHANLIEVHGLGILLIAKSGFGKSEISLELLKKGHQFVADDTVIYKRVLGTIYGEPQEGYYGIMEVRGLGIINLEKIYGIKNIKEKTKIDIIVEIIDWSNKINFDRIGSSTKYKKLFDVKIPFYKIPITPGKKMSDIIELMAANHKLKQMGYSSFDELNKNCYKKRRD